jgi:hypothetical protein
MFRSEHHEIYSCDPRSLAAPEMDADHSKSWKLAASFSIDLAKTLALQISIGTIRFNALFYFHPHQSYAEMPLNSSLFMMSLLTNRMGSTATDVQGRGALPPLTCVRHSLLSSAEAADQIGSHDPQTVHTKRFPEWREHMGLSVIGGLAAAMTLIYVSSSLTFAMQMMDV